MSKARSYVHGYTVLLFVYGFLLVTAAITMYSMAAREAEDQAWVMRLAANFEAVLAAGCLAVAVLRSLGSQVAEPATSAISIVLAISFPFGTAAFVWWLVSIRKLEREPASGPS